MSFQTNGFGFIFITSSLPSSNTFLNCLQYSFQPNSSFFYVHYRLWDRQYYPKFTKSKSMAAIRLKRNGDSSDLCWMVHFAVRTAERVYHSKMKISPFKSVWVFLCQPHGRFPLDHFMKERSFHNLGLRLFDIKKIPSGWLGVNGGDKTVRLMNLTKGDRKVNCLARIRFLSFTKLCTSSSRTHSSTLDKPSSRQIGCVFRSFVESLGLVITTPLL